MIHLLDPSTTRQQAEYWERKARTNRRISLAAKTILAVTLAVTIVGIILAVIL